MSSHRILHQFTCPNTSQQNGVTERKNRHLIEILGASVLDHEGGIILRTCFLMNRIPSSSLDNKIPRKSTK